MVSKSEFTAIEVEIKQIRGEIAALRQAIQALRDEMVPKSAGS